MDQETTLSNVQFLQTNRSFLGREFLTWLWFKSESQNHQISTKNHGDFQFYIDDKLILTSASGSSRESIFKGGTPAYADEALSALLAGKMIQEAKFVLQNKDHQWMFSVNADDLSFKGVRLPTASHDTLGELILTRIAFMQMLSDIFDFLFKEYLDLRLSGDILKELELMNDWIQEKSSI